MPTRKKVRTVTEIKGVLEIHHDRGVIYFHITDEGFITKHGVQTALRICRLPKPIPSIHERGLDITHMVGTDWGSEGKDGFE